MASWPPPRASPALAPRPQVGTQRRGGRGPSARQCWGPEADAPATGAPSPGRGPRSRRLGVVGESPAARLAERTGSRVAIRRTSASCASSAAGSNSEPTSPEGGHTPFVANASATSAAGRDPGRAVPWPGSTRRPDRAASRRRWAAPPAALRHPTTTAPGGAPTPHRARARPTVDALAGHTTSAPGRRTPATTTPSHRSTVHQLSGAPTTCKHRHPGPARPDPGTSLRPAAGR